MIAERPRTDNEEEEQEELLPRPTAYELVRTNLPTLSSFPDVPTAPVRPSHHTSADNTALDEDDFREEMEEDTSLLAAREPTSGAINPHPEPVTFEVTESFQVSDASDTIDTDLQPQVRDNYLAATTATTVTTSTEVVADSSSRDYISAIGPGINTGGSAVPTIECIEPTAPPLHFIDHESHTATKQQETKQQQQSQQQQMQLQPQEQQQSQSQQQDLFGGLKVHYTFNPSHYSADNIDIQATASTKLPLVQSIPLPSLRGANKSTSSGAIVHSAGEGAGEGTLVTELLAENSRLSEEVQQLRSQLQLAQLQSQRGQQQQSVGAPITGHVTSVQPPPSSIAAGQQNMKYILCGGCRQWMSAQRDAVYVVCSRCNSINNCNLNPSDTATTSDTETRALTQQQRPSSSSLFWFMDCF